MDKYSDAELKEMATTVLEADKKGDGRCFMFFMMLAVRTGLTIADIQNRTRYYANLKCT